MHNDRQRQITELYHAALERDERDRAAFLREACAGDDALRREVESLLGYEDAAAPFLERPAIEDVAPLVASRPESTGDLVGRRIGGYQIEARIGAGGMGEVYRARDTKLGRDVAIKVLPPHLMADADRRARFEREARLLATLNHSNIAQIYGLEESDGLQALVMELVPGETLDRIDQAAIRTRLKVEAALALARQIADAVDAAHETGSHPPRLEAGQYRGHAGRRGEGARLRPGQSRGRGRVRSRSVAVADDHRGSDARRRHPRDARLHESGTGARQAGRQAHRHLGLRLRAVRDADRAPGVQRARPPRTPSPRSWNASRTGTHCPRRPPRPFVVCCSGAWRRIRRDA